MPIYEYKCNDCGKDSEILLKSMSAEARCPQCDSADLEKLISVPGAVTVKQASQPEMPGMCPRAKQCGATGCPGAMNR